jgi:hypothetical protein
MVAFTWHIHSFWNPEQIAEALETSISSALAPPTSSSTSAARRRSADPTVLVVGAANERLVEGLEDDHQVVEGRAWVIRIGCLREAAASREGSARSRQHDAADVGVDHRLPRELARAESASWSVGASREWAWPYAAAF